MLRLTDLALLAAPLAAWTPAAPASAQDAAPAHLADRISFGPD